MGQKRSGRGQDETSGRGQDETSGSPADSPHLRPFVFCPPLPCGWGHLQGSLTEAPLSRGFLNFLLRGGTSRRWKGPGRPMGGRSPFPAPALPAFCRPGLSTISPPVLEVVTASGICCFRGLIAPRCFLSSCLPFCK